MSAGRHSPGVAGANLVGLAAILVALLLQGIRWLRGLYPSGLFGADAGQLEWAEQLLWLSLYAIALLLPFFFLRRTSRPLAVKIHDEKGRLPMGAMLLLFLGSMLALNILVSLLRGLAGHDFNASATLPQTWAGNMVYLLQIAVVAPLCEELLFRGAIQGLLQPWGVRQAIGWTVLLFTLLHTQLWNVPVVLLLAWLLGYFAQMNGSIRPGIFLHAANNLLAFLLTWLQTLEIVEVSNIAIIALFAISAGCALAGALLLKKYIKAISQPASIGNKKLQRKQGAERPAMRLVSCFCMGIASSIIYFIINMQI